MRPDIRAAFARGAVSAPAAGRTVLAGLLGKDIGLSRSPAMHEAEGRAQGLCYVYRLLDAQSLGGTPPNLGDILRHARFFGFSGLNVTHPYKQEIIAHLDGLSGNAEAIGSVNTVVMTDGRWIGHNTDCWGFGESLRTVMPDAPLDCVLLLGAGGAGAAVARALLLGGAQELLIADTDRDRSVRLAERLSRHFGRALVAVADSLADAAARACGIVNASPVGMASQPGLPIPAALIAPPMWVADIVYFPLETEFLKNARQKGCRTLNGEGMAVFQAVRAFELFTGLAPDVERMKAAFAAFIRP